MVRPCALSFANRRLRSLEMSASLIFCSWPIVLSMPSIASLNLRFARSKFVENPFWNSSSFFSKFVTSMFCWRRLASSRL